MEKKQEKSAWQFLKDIWPFYRPYKRDLIGTGVWTVAMQLLALVEPYLLMFIIDDIVAHGRDAKARVLPMVGGAFFLLIFTTFVKLLKDRRIRNIVSRLEADLPGQVLHKLLTLPLSYHHGTNAGQSVSRVQDGVDRVRELVWVLFYEVFPAAIQTIIVTVALSWMSLPIAAIVVVTMALAWWRLIVIKRKTSSLRLQRLGQRREWNRVFSEFVGNVMTVQAYSRQHDAAHRVAQIGEQQRLLMLKEFGANDWGYFWRNCMINLARVGIVLVCAWLVFGNLMSLGQIVFVSMLVERLFSANFQLSNTYDRFVEASEPVKALVETMQEEETIKDPSNPLPAPSGPTTIGFTGASYAYPSKPDQPALSDLGFEIKAGTMVGIVGESGHGKSTLAKLLMRYDDPTFGVLTVSGLNYRSLSLAELRSLFGYVPQEVELFNASIADNIRYGKPDATEAEIVAAAKLARADVFIDRTTDGYETLIGDRGLRLSGGERQRVGIARAILTGAPILLFDEATSSVDADTIHEIKRAMASLRKDRTLIVITHQLSTVQDADVLIVLDHGRISGMGTHTELVRSNETYRRFVQLQQNAEASLIVRGDPRDIS